MEGKSNTNQKGVSTGISAKNNSSNNTVKKCKLNEDRCVSLADILVAFNAPISEEHAWAVCYQCAKCFRNELKSNAGRCRVVTNLGQVLLHKDGHIHPNTIYTGGSMTSSTSGNSGSGMQQKRAPTAMVAAMKNAVATAGANIAGKNASDLSLANCSQDHDVDRQVGPSEEAVVQGLGLVLYFMLDFGIDEEEERVLSSELRRLIENMTDIVENVTETDDEGIERDSCECEEGSSSYSLARVQQECASRLGGGPAQEADFHYRAVCRALVAEAQELWTFLETVGTKQIIKVDEDTRHLDTLNFNDWAKLWVQVIRELRRGVQLKKVCYTRKPIEYELTPYEILMDDIRSRKYKLNKVMVDGSIPHKVKKDAHAIILEFIRSRPPLRKASERKLNPPRPQTSTPREILMESIKKGRVKLKPSPINKNSREQISPVTPCSAPHSEKKLIKIDYSVLSSDEEDEVLEVTKVMDDDDDEEKLEIGGGTGRRDLTDIGVGVVINTAAGEGTVRSTADAPTATSAGNPWTRTGSLKLSKAEIDHYCDTALQCTAPNNNPLRSQCCIL